jgi:hypothetical protein
MPEETHTYHHNPPAVVDLKVGHNTRGDTWEIEVKGAKDGAEAVALYLETRDKLEPHVLPAPKEGKGD